MGYGARPACDHDVPSDRLVRERGPLRPPVRRDPMDVPAPRGGPRPLAAPFVDRGPRGASRLAGCRGARLVLRPVRGPRRRDAESDPPAEAARDHGPPRLPPASDQPLPPPPPP